MAEYELVEQTKSNTSNAYLVLHRLTIFFDIKNTDLREGATICNPPPPFVNFQSHVTPLNMQSCFVNDEFVVWVDNSGKAPSPPLARGAKGVAKGSPGAPGPIDPNTGKPLFSLVGNLVRGKK